MSTLTHSIIEYRGYSIQPDFYGHKWSYMFYPTEQGVQHDADGDSDGYHYTGNCKWADSIDEAKDAIFEKIMVGTFYKVETFGPFSIGGQPHLHITKFYWLEDAMKFVAKFNGNLSVSFSNP